MDRFNKIIAPFSMDRLAQDGMKVTQPVANVGRAISNGVGRAAGGLKRMVASKMPKMPSVGQVGRKIGGPLINNFVDNQDNIRRMSQ